MSYNLQRTFANLTHISVEVDSDILLDKTPDVLITDTHPPTMPYKEKTKLINFYSFQVSAIIAHFSSSLLELWCGPFWERQSGTRTQVMDGQPWSIEETPLYLTVAATTAGNEIPPCNIIHAICRHAPLSTEDIAWRRLWRHGIFLTTFKRGALQKTNEVLAEIFI